MIGVNVFNQDPKALKAVMTKEKLNWRSFTAQDAIARQWNNPGTPTFYVLDPQGAIRHKWVGNPGEKTLDAALEKLIQAAEKTAAK